MQTIKTIAIVGGSGFVGKALAQVLLGRGYALRIVVRGKQRVSEKLERSADVRRGDVHDPKFLIEALAGVDAVINLVGILNQGKRHGQSFQAAHIDLPREIATACCKLGITRLIQMSALNASAAKGVSHYLLSKGEGESAAKVNGGPKMRYTVFRPSVVFGPDDGLTSQFATIIRLSPFFIPLACARSLMAPVYIGDLATAMANALEQPESIGRRYDICGPQTYTLGELVTLMASVMGKRRKVIPLPDFLARWQAALLQHFPGKPFTPDNYRSLQQPSVCDCNQLPELGVTPTTMESVLPGYLGPTKKR